MTSIQPVDPAKPTERGGGVIVRPFSHYAGHWRAEQKLRVHSGAKLKMHGDAPRDDWRTPRDVELSRLTGGDTDGADLLVVEVFTFPNHLRNDSWGLNLDSDQVSAGSGVSQEYRAFAARLLEYLEFIRVPVNRTCTIRAEISRPGGGPSWTAAGPPAGDKVASDGRPVAESTTIMLNFGFEPRGVVWANQDPSCPWVRLALEPGEACFGPFRQMQLVQDTLGMTEPDFNLIVEPSESEQHANKDLCGVCHD
ncbi:MAG: hypothetical protein O2967_02045 [Proteobacteria bacterium]|nr:hypothetical protein [Pseudomonadota bacterium]